MLWFIFKFCRLFYMIFVGYKGSWYCFKDAKWNKGEFTIQKVAPDTRKIKDKKGRPWKWVSKWQMLNDSNFICEYTSEG